ncbi:hypothetical protein MUU48_01160 [Scandinavium sp. H11S7]|nr:hypothetical protein [Scandinavium hiltneri]
MKYKTLAQVHEEAMKDPAYREAWDVEEAIEQSVEAVLTSAQVAERMADSFKLQQI